MKLTNSIVTTNRVEQAKSAVIALFVFGTLGAWIGVHVMYGVDARQDDRINAVLRANRPAPSAPAAPVQASPTATPSPAPVFTPGK